MLETLWVEDLTGESLCLSSVDRAGEISIAGREDQVKEWYFPKYNRCPKSASFHLQSEQSVSVRVRRVAVTFSQEAAKHYTRQQVWAGPLATSVAREW